MPRCFQLYRKADLEAGPVILAHVDNELCAHLGVEPHERNFYYGWYDCIGIRLAVGRNYDEIEAEFKEHVAKADDASPYYEEMLKILAWMREHFQPSSWSTW